MLREENRKEREAREALETRLEVGEELLAYSSGTLAGLISRPHHIGLTEGRIILLPVKRGKPAGQAYGIGRRSVGSLKWSGMLWPRLRIALPKDNFDISFRARGWRKRARELTDLASKPALSSELLEVPGRHALQQSRDFLGLGFIASAQHELGQALLADPNLSADPSLATLQDRLDEASLALRVGAAFLFANIGVAILIASLLAVLGGGQAVADFLGSNLIISLLFDLWIGASLWQRRVQWRPWAIFRAGLGFIFFGLLSIIEGGLLDLVTQAAFSGSLILVLTGESKRSRTWLAIGIYVLGYLGLLGLSILIALAGALLT